MDDMHNGMYYFSHLLSYQIGWILLWRHTVPVLQRRVYFVKEQNVALILYVIFVLLNINICSIYHTFLKSLPISQTGSWHQWDQ